jgi:glycosyltransferase involved in cell wall biosynthesis
LKLLLLTSERGLRGGEGQLLILAEGLARRGHQVIVGAPPGAELFAQLPETVERFPFQARWDVDVFAARRLRTALLGLLPDLIHAFTARAHAMGRWARQQWCPLVVSRLVSFPAGKGPFGRRKYQQGVAAYAAVSRTAAQSLVRAGVSPDIIRVIPTALRSLPAPVRARGAIRSRMGLSESGPVVGAVSHLTEGKGFAFLLRAVVGLLSEFRDLEICIVGEGPARAALEAEAAQLGLNYRLKLPGRAATALDVSEALAALDVFVLPSLSEGLPSAILEAMGAGTPVVAAAVGGIPDLIVDRNNGRLVPPNSVEPLAQVLRELLSSPKERARLAGAAQAGLGPYQPERVIDSYEQLYASVLGD